MAEPLMNAAARRDRVALEPLLAHDRALDRRAREANGEAQHPLVLALRLDPVATHHRTVAAVSGRVTGERAVLRRAHRHERPAS
jgi:hypothetical protein